MVQSIIDIGEHEDRILNIVKAKYGLKNKSQAVAKIASVFEDSFLEPELRPEFVDMLEKKGLVFSGYHLRKDQTKLMEYIELPKHPYFVGTQAHPEFKSRLGNPSPLFYGFVKACAK